MFILVQECDATLSPSDVGAVVRTALIATAALENEKAKSILGNFLIELGARLPATARAASGPRSLHCGMSPQPKVVSLSGGGVIRA